MKTLTSTLAVILLTSCAYPSTAGFTKDQKATLAIEKQKRTTAWTVFGLTFLSKAVDFGVSAFANGGNIDRERQLPRPSDK